MKPDNTYIKISEEDENYTPSDAEVQQASDELKLDNFNDVEYNTPYTTYGEDNFDFGGSFETGGIFDDR